jgi:hypothetical protein
MDHDAWLLDILDQAIEISEELDRELKQQLSRQTKDAALDQNDTPPPCGNQSSRLE